jgi:hypothetical protein
MKEKFSIEEIENYIQSLDSLEDVMYNLSPSNIRKANKQMSFTYQEIINSGNWIYFCEDYDINEKCINKNEETEINIFISDAKKWNLI